MSESFFSPSWYRVAQLKPRLRPHSQIHRQHYRGELWYVLQDHVTGRFYRFTPVAYHVIGLMDGSLSVNELWELAAERFGDDAPSQADMVRLLSQLHVADVLICDVPPDTLELFQRSRNIEKSKLQANLRSPLFLRIPLLDPENFLARSVRFVRPFFSLGGFIIWLAVVLSAVVAGSMHWAELTENIVDRVLAANNLAIIWFVYPLIKTCHELGHGYAVKRWGGEVHEMGVMLLVLMPIPYVDATSATAFRDKYHRVLVGSAGIMAELLLAAVAMFCWIAMDPGIGRSIAYNTILIGSVSSVLFNGNPLLRYDGYYILSDLIEIPNLAQRSLGYLGYLAKSKLLGVKEIEEPYTAPGEKKWLVLFASSSFIYRLFVYVAIIMFIAGKFFYIGILLAFWAGLTMFFMPVFKQVKQLFTAPGLRDKKMRTFAVGSSLVFVVLLLFVIPFPYRSSGEGVVWAPERSLVRAGTNGFITKINAEPNSLVSRDNPLIEFEDPLLETDVQILRSRLSEFETRYRAAYAEDQVKARIILEELESIRSNLGRAMERCAELKLLSQVEGVFVLPYAADLPGRFVRKGELIGYVIGNDGLTIRVVVPQTEADLIRNHTRRVDARPADTIGRIYGGRIVREVPGAVENLPSSVLSSIGGGEIAIDPMAKGQMKTFEKMFQFEIELDEPFEEVFLGNRVFLRFDHGYKPLGLQWYRDIRQLLLKRFNV